MIFNLYLRRLLSATVAMIVCIVASLPLAAQNSRLVTGVVVDAQNKPLEGSTVQVKETNIITSTDANGKFSLSVPNGRRVLVVSYVGKPTQEVTIGSQNSITVTLTEASAEMDQVVIVGYGRQRKASVVGAISQATGKDLERTGGVTNLGMALTGNLPGLITTTTTGMPGVEDPQILIRAQTTWNGGGPLILVDGIERPMGSVDITSVETLSILKDASATAVYGVRGANGVILITTRKGVEGKPNIRVRTNATMKVASKLPEKYDAYDALVIKNRVIERQLPVSAADWVSFRPIAILDKYRNPANDAEWDRYPNVDWEKELFRDYAMSYNTSLNISGGSNLVTYFAAVDYVYEGDLYKSFENDRGYKSGFGYTRTNMRSNLDFNLTKTTKLTTRLFGSNGVRKVPFAMPDNDNYYWRSVYRTAPDAMRPIYSDGTWAYYNPRNDDVPNSMFLLATSGVEKRTDAQLTSDLVLQQDLNVITKGLNIRGNFSFDHRFLETGRGMDDRFNSPQRKWINPETGFEVFENPLVAATQMDYPYNQVRWSTQGGSVDRGRTYRRLNYSFALNYGRKFGKHDLTGLALMQREKYATGNEFARFREDWVFRATYNYNGRYFFESNGAYNGSEKYGPDYRFAFFPSFSAGWTLSNEKFMDNVKFINLLKLRGSWGIVGDDNGGSRFAYTDQWNFGGNAQMGSPVANTPYTFYRISQLGNPNLSWETVEKRNVGVDYSVLNGKISGSVDVFSDDRQDIVISGNDRAVSTYFGGQISTAPAANLGRVKGEGYEVELKLNHAIGNGLRIWANTSLTHAKNTVIYRDDPELLPAHLKRAGWQLGRTVAFLNSGYLQTWDDLLGSTERNSNDLNRLAGDYNIIDFNGDGLIDDNDRAPVNYSGTPLNTYNASIGFDWKGFSMFVQFYGVNNVTRDVTFPTFETYPGSNVAYVEGSYWVKGSGGDVPLPRFNFNSPKGNEGTRYLYDGSYVRLKNAEIAYTLNGSSLRRVGIKSCRIYANGNNLFLWTDMPDDRESNFSGSSSFGAYPTMKRFNLGIDINL